MMGDKKSFQLVDENLKFDPAHYISCKYSFKGVGNPQELPTSKTQPFKLPRVESF